MCTKECRDMIILQVCCLVVLLHGSRGSNVTWYQGCFQFDGSTETTKETSQSFPSLANSRLAGCGNGCLTHRFEYFAVKSVDSRFHCFCINSTEALVSDSSCCKHSNEDHLPVGSTQDCYGVYTSAGPYLTAVAIATDEPLAIVNAKIAIDISVERAAALDVTEESGQLGHVLNIQWSVRGNNSVINNTLDMTDLVELAIRPKHTFTEVGNYTIDVTVSNGLSFLSTSHDIVVIYPAPDNLQVDIFEDDLDLPSCIPSQVKVTKVGYEQFAVFVDTSLHIEASVTMGTDLTFSFWFEDTDDESNRECSKCTSVLEAHTFRSVGEWTVIVTVNNSYGYKQKNVTMIVIERQLTDLQIHVDPQSSSSSTSALATTTDDPVKYTISLVTTSRNNLTLQVWYGDGHSNMVSIEDTEFPALVLTGDGQEMDIVADYGNGCELTVEFNYVYRHEGLYRPTVALYNKNEHETSKRGSMTLGRSESLMPFTDLQLMQQLGLVENTGGIFVPKVTENREMLVPGVNEHREMLVPGATEHREILVPGMGSNSNMFVPGLIDHRDMLVKHVPMDSQTGNRPIESGKNDVEALLQAELQNEVLVVRELTMVTIDVKNAVGGVVSCEDELELTVRSPARHNISVHWKILRISDSVHNSNTTCTQNLFTGYSYHDDDYYYADFIDEGDTKGSVFQDLRNSSAVVGDLEVVKDHTSSSLTLRHSLTQVGVYMVSVEVENVLSSAKSSISIVSQCPITGLYATCSPEYVETGGEMVCTASMLNGSDVLFVWIIDGDVATQYVHQENHTSCIKHRFQKPGIYDISVQTVNNISSSYYEIDTPIRVQNPIRDFEVVKRTRNLLGNVTFFGALYKPRDENDFCYFDFDFGNGRQKVQVNVCENEICLYAEVQYRFPHIGQHLVTVYAYNLVSELSKTVEVWVYPSLKDISIEMIGESVVGEPTRFIVRQHGETMVTDNVYFTWRLEGEEEQFTNSPLFQVTFTEAGNQTLTVNATNPVDTIVIAVAIEVLEQTEVKVELLHDLYVTLNSHVTFTIKGPVLGWSQLRVYYSDGVSETYDHGTYIWQHQFQRIGIQQVFVTALGGSQGTSTEVSSYIIVEEPVTGLKINGAPVVLYNKEYDTVTWMASLDSGSHVIYKWTQARTSVMTIPQFEIGVPLVGEYILQVEAYNDITDPITTEMTFLVQHPIKSVQTTIVGNLVGKETLIQASISAYHPFYILTSFGDGSTESIYSEDFLSGIESVDEDHHYVNFTVNFTHVYTAAADYEVVVKVSNNISSEASSKLFVPIEDIALIPKSPWLIETPGYAKVVAVVTGGQDLTFTWNFSDDYGETHVRRYVNQTSVAIHPYGMSGEYPVTFCVTGEHYPPHPGGGVCKSLDFNFTVVDPIQVLKMILHSKKYDRDAVALEGNRTRQVVFGYESSGSHVKYLFDFGDGSDVKEVAGIQLPPQSLEMTMYGEGRHVYTEVGVYPVMVTAVNPLGNVSLPRPHMFHVQEPPRGLQFCNYGDGPVGRVGQNISLCASVTSGTNVTFDWKLGDQTDLINAGPRITHQYQAAKQYKVFVFAKNKVESINKSIIVDINHDIQGVTLTVEKHIVAVRESVWFEAVARPNFTNIVSKYQWSFTSQSRSRHATSRSSLGRHSFATYNSGRTLYMFESPGWWKVSVLARNSISSATSETVEIQVQAKVSSLEIIISGDATLRLVNRSITFDYLSYSGTNVRLTWDFGEGTRLENTTETRVEHTFSSEGRYTISLTAWNDVSSQTVTRPLFVLEKSYCNQPEVKILLQNMTQVAYSKTLTIEADVKPHCNLTSIMTYTWSIQTISTGNKSSSNHVGNQQIGRSATRNHKLDRRVLVLPPRTLAHGLHRIRVEVEMKGTIVQAESSMFVEIVPSPLVSKIKGGVYRQARKGDALVMDGSLSYDPDTAATNNDTTLSYIWTCYYTKDNGNYGYECFNTESEGNNSSNTSCTELESSLTNSNTSVLVIPGDCLVEASNFTFELTVSSPEGRQNTSFQVVHMIDENREILDISIVQPYSDPQQVNADRKLAFYTECSNCDSKGGIKYEWTLTHLWDEHRWNLARAHDLKCVEPDGTSYSLILEEEEEEKKRKAEEEEAERLKKSQEERPELDGVRERRDLPANLVEQLFKEMGLESMEWRNQTANIPHPVFGQIVEGGVSKGSKVASRRRRGLETSTDFPYPFVNALGSNLPIPNPYDISENIEDNLPRIKDIRDTLKMNINEGTPGESGSSIGRNPFTVKEGTPGATRPQSKVNPVDPKLDRDPDSSTGTVDKLVNENGGLNRGRKFTILDQIPVHDFLQEVDTRTGLTGESLVIRPGVLKQGWTYILQLRAYDEERHLAGHAMSSFTVNKSPVHGKCTISPLQGVAMETEFNVHCYEWRDMHEPLMYEVSYSMSATLDDKHLVYRGLDHEFALRLPAGHPHQQNNVYVSIVILDSLLAKTSVCEIPIKVTPRNLTESATHNSNRVKTPSMSRLVHDEITSPEGILQEAVDTGNDAVSKVYISYLADALNTASESHNLEQHRKLNITAHGDVETDQTRETLNETLESFEVDISGKLEATKDSDVPVYNVQDGERTSDGNGSIHKEDVGTTRGPGYKDREDVGTRGGSGSTDRDDVGTSGGSGLAYGEVAGWQEEEEDRAEDKQLRVDARTDLLRVLEKLPVRDEAEILQTAQALSYVTAKQDELGFTSIHLSVKILKSLSDGAREVYSQDLTPTGDLIQLAVQATGSIVKARTEIGQDADSNLESAYKRHVSESVQAVEDLVLNELQYHVISEEPINSTTDYFSILSARHSAQKPLSLGINQARFKLPKELPQLLDNAVDGTISSSANENCLQSHMTTFQKNPFSFGDAEKVNSVVSGLNLYDCKGKSIHVADLPQDRRVQVELPNIAPQTRPPLLKLQRWAMNQHQFNVSEENQNLSLHLVIDLVPVHKGRLFPITVLISRSPPVSQDDQTYLYKFDFEPGYDNIDQFFPAGTFNASTYYLGIVDSTYNAGRPRPGEITQREYDLRMWWGECLYWDVAEEAWSPDGCRLSSRSTYAVTRCECSHLTVFGGRFELIPNKLELLDVDNFFSLRTNPVTLTLVSIVVTLYLLLLVWCRHGDRHDARKGGIVYLLDNTSVDQQKYEITVETGIRKGAGTTAKISVILHGEEGMSETRELISEDDRPMFEGNSRDKFILTLPESIGRIWKVQVWHNNAGESPSWFLSRVIVRDLNTGNLYLFQCDKWLAVEEEDGKVEREFMVQEAPPGFSKVFVAKVVQYMADLHLWLSLATCPPYSGFVRVERLTVCLTIVMLHMCFTAIWYQHTVTEYRGEFSLLDVSWQNVSVGATCCAIVIPIALFLEILFRRSKPKHASSLHCKDEGSKWDVGRWDADYPSGKSNDRESEDTTSDEHVPPVMTYSLLDQSILNWPNIQTWAQKQWMKRQQSVRSHHADTNNAGLGRHGNHLSDRSLANNPLIGLVPGTKPTSTVESAFTGQGFSETDQASSGFEDCGSLIRPKASMDSGQHTHTTTTAAPSPAESLRTHRPESPGAPPGDGGRVGPGGEGKTVGAAAGSGSVADSVKAPSISSSGSSNKSSVLSEKKVSFLSHVYLPYWCRYIAWSLCALICVVSAALTIMYGFRFGVMKSILWLQSLYFSCLICVCLAYPLLVLLAATYTSLWHLLEPGNLLDMSDYDLFNREKAKADLHRWKKQMELLEEEEALERGVAARQRSRYLRFARPPQEKQLIEARKRILKEKKAITIFRESVAFAITIFLLLFIAYGKDLRPSYHLNKAVRSQFVLAGTPNFTSIQSRDQWYSWFQFSFLNSLQLVPRLEKKTRVSSGPSSTYIIGSVQLRQQRVTTHTCKTPLPYDTMGCLDDTVAMDTHKFRGLEGVTFTQGYFGNFMVGRETVYDGSGYVLTLNQSRSEASLQVDNLRAASWLDRQSRVVMVELTLYNAPTSLFMAVNLMAEMSPTGTVFPIATVTSTYLFRYVTAWDNLVLTCELLYFLVMIYQCKILVSRLLKQGKLFFTLPWNVLNCVICVLSVVYCTSYICRFIIVSTIVESLRSSYYEKYINVSFIAFWDEMLKSTVSVLLFLSFLKCLRLLRYNKQFAIFGDVYRRARREVLTLFALFCCITAAYSSLGHVLFGCAYSSFRDLLSSVTAVSALMVGQGLRPPPVSPGGQGDRMAANIFLFTFCIFGLGFLTIYMVAVLTHYFRSRRKRRLLAMGSLEALLFYWRQFQLWSGILRPEQAEEEIIVLPPEFTMAEIEYQVDELLFRMNALTGSHGLPEKPPCYLTDSDCTYGGGDDGISSGGSEACQLYGEDRLEQRVQKIEDNLCSKEPFLAQLLKLDGITTTTDDWSHEKEKQLRSHLELEIFRQLQIQRQDLKSPSTEAETTGVEKTEEVGDKLPTASDNIQNDDLTSADGQKPAESVDKSASSPLATQILQDLATKPTHDHKESHNDNSSSNPDSPLDKLSFNKVKKNTDSILKPRQKPNSSSTSSSEKISPDLSLNHTYLTAETEALKKPTKPTFLHSRESSLSEASKGSPSLKVHTDKGTRSEALLGGIERMLESSSGSEQDGIRVGRKMSGKRNLRKTKSRGKGKGADSLEPALIFDELDMEEGEGFRGEVTPVESAEKGVKPVDKGGKFKDGKEHTVMADIHHVSNR